jgi:hypothetical protein
MFIDAFERDEVFSDPYSQSAYLDLETGKVIWVFEEDHDAEMYAGIDPEENAALRITICNEFEGRPGLNGLLSILRLLRNLRKIYATHAPQPWRSMPYDYD